MHLRPAKRVMEDPKGGWRGADLSLDELVDDDVIAAQAVRVYPPLMPADEKLFPVKGAPDGA